MRDNSSEFIGDIPKHYDAGLGPVLFEDFAERLAATACERSVTSAIELAAGTGILSRRLRNHLEPDTPLLVTDLNAPMLETAKAKFAQGENVDFAVADAMKLDFEDDAFDLMVCQFGVMFFPEKPVAFREAARVLKPGGRFVFNVFSEMGRNPYSKIAYDIPAQYFPDDPPSFYKVPFHYGDPQGVLRDLEAAGWRDVTYETVRLQKKIENPAQFADGLVFGNPSIDVIRARGTVAPDTIAEAMHKALIREFGPTDMVMPLEAKIFVCTVH